MGRDKGDVDFQELVKFIEVVTELVKGEDAVNTRDIRGIVKQMFEMCKKDADDGKLSKEEFINWYGLYLEFFTNLLFFSCFSCRQDVRIRCAFVPDNPGKKF